MKTDSARETAAIAMAVHEAACGLKAAKGSTPHEAERYAKPDDHKKSEQDGALEGS